MERFQTRTLQRSLRLIYCGVLLQFFFFGSSVSKNDLIIVDINGSGLMYIITWVYFNQVLMEIDKFTKATFYMNGVSSLLGWNVILSAFDFFQNAFPGRDVTTYFPIPLFIAYVMVGLMYNRFQKMFSYKKMIIFGLVLTNISIIATLIVSLALKDTTAGYVICMILMWVLGAAGNITQLSFFAIINYLSAKIVSIFTVGTALSMLLTTIVRIIILAILGHDSDNLSAICIYMAIGLLTNFIDLGLNIKFFKSQIYQEMVAPHELHSNEDEDPEEKVNNDVVNTDAGKHTKMSYFQHMLQAHKEVYPCDTLILLNYVQTFMLFPSLSLGRQFSFPGAWPVTILVLSYAIGDTAGKAFCSKRSLFNEKSVFYIFLTRFYFFWTIIMLSKPSVLDPLLNNDALAYVNQFFFAFTNGIATNGNFVLAFEKASTVSKRYAGILCGLNIQFGIMIGTILAIPMQLI